MLNSNKIFVLTNPTIRYMKYIIACGGTGGHIYPGIAIANELKKYTDNDVLFIGVNGHMEIDILKNNGFEIHGIDIIGLNRKNLFKNIFLIPKLIKSFFQSMSIVKNFNPDTIIGMGGYVTVPVVIAAKLCGKTIYLQEQNAVPGLANKMLHRFARKVFTGFPNMEKYFGDKSIYIGNPTINPDINTDSNSAYEYFNLSTERPIALIIGGSLGAKNIIDTILKNNKTFANNNIQILLSIGKNNNIEDFKNRYKFDNSFIKVLSYIDRMDYAYSIASIVVSRAGAITISELCNYKKPTIFIPSPNVTNNHQMKNVRQLILTNSAILIEEKNIDTLPAKITQLINDKEQLKQLSENISKYSKPTAAHDIVNYMKL